MEKWMEHFSRLGDRLLGEPATAGEMWMIVGVAIIVAILVFNKVAEAFRIPNTGKGNSAIMVLLSLAVVLAAMTASSIYLEPKLSSAQAQWATPGIGILASLLLATPLIVAFLRGSYIGSLSTWGITCGAIAAAIYITASGWELVSHSGEEMKSGKDRRDNIQDIIDN